MKNVSAACLLLALCGCFASAAVPTSPESMIYCETYSNAPSAVTTTPPLYKPQDIAVDGAGDIFVVDSARRDLIRIDGVTQESTILLGSQLLQIPVGLTISPNHGDLYIGDENTSTVWHLSCTTRGNASCGHYSSVAHNITLGTKVHPVGLHIDNEDHLFIADFNGHRVLRRDATSGSVKVLLSEDNMDPKPTKPFGPHDIAIDANDYRLLVTDISNDDIWVLKCKQLSKTKNSCLTYNPTPFKLDLSGTAANIEQPSGIVTDLHDVIYVTGKKHGIVAEIKNNVSVDLLQAMSEGTLKDPVSISIDLRPKSKALYISDDPVSPSDTAQGLWKLACTEFRCVALDNHIIPNVIPHECMNVPVGQTCKFACAAGYESPASQIACTAEGWAIAGIQCNAIPGTGNGTTTVPAADAAVGVGIGITIAVVAVLGLGVFLFLRFKQGKLVVKTTTYGSAGV